jgi:hypothetical protein
MDFAVIECGELPRATAGVAHQPGDAEYSMSGAGYDHVTMDVP